MSTKKINAGDTLTVGDLTDDHLGAVIEVGPRQGITERFRLDRIERDDPRLLTMWTAESGLECVYLDTTVKVIAPPPVVQPDEPTVLGQCIRIEGDDDLQAVVADPGSGMSIVNHEAIWCSWEEVLDSAGDRQIIVSDPPRWPDETPAVPERIEVGEWPGDVSLRAYRWVDREGDSWTWRDREYGGLGWGITSISSYESPLAGPWTRGERVK